MNKNYWVPFCEKQKNVSAKNIETGTVRRMVNTRPNVSIVSVASIGENTIAIVYSDGKQATWNPLTDNIKWLL